MTESNETLHPGRILLTQAMEPLGISRNQLARDIDVPVGRISDITNGKRGITADTALRLGRYFGTGPELWLRLQAEYDLYVAYKTTWPAVEGRVRILSTQPDSANAQGAETPEADPAPTDQPFQAHPDFPAEAPAELPEDEEPSLALGDGLPGDDVDPPLEPVVENPVEPPATVTDIGAGQDLPADDPYVRPQAIDTGEIPDDGDTTETGDEPLDLSEPATVEPVPEADDQNPVFERDFDDDEEDLGIPPAPDQTKMLMSG